MADTLSVTMPGTDGITEGDQVPAQIIDLPRSSRQPKVLHAQDCPLQKMDDEHANSLIYEAAHYGWKNRSAQSVLEAIAVCDSCRTRFRERTTQHRQEVYAYVRGLAEKLGEMQQQKAAFRANRIWITEDIESALRAAPSLRTHTDGENVEVWDDLFHAFVSLMREACDVRYPELPFVRLGAGLIPQNWQERDALDFIATETNLGNRGIMTGLEELERLIREHLDQAIEPLGWFVPDENEQLCLIGWQGLLDQQYGDVGKRSHMKETTASLSNSLSKENAAFLKKIQHEARVKNVTI